MTTFSTSSTAPARSWHTAHPKRRSLTTLDGLTHWDAFVAKVPIAFARKHGVMGMLDGESPLLVFSAEPDPEALDALRRRLGVHTSPCVLSSTPTGDVPLHALTMAINAGYEARANSSTHSIRELPSLNEALSTALSDREDLLDDSARPPVIKLVNALLLEAIRVRASDVHLQPLENVLKIRMRIDGVLEDSADVPKHVQDELISRIKVMSKMNIAEKRLAQDGRASVELGDSIVDLRVASMPTCFGERVVIRVLDNRARTYRLDDLGMNADTLARFGNLVALEHGIVLVTGPTGSGKTTTLYAALESMDRSRHNVLTLEDPIEYLLPGVSQTQVADRKGLSFASGLRSVLRQDPDIIMVGEIRDRDTAAMAIQSALTGHLVFSTLHTNDAASAMTRLLDLGIEPYLAASSVIGLLAQRLVRRVCDACSTFTPPTPVESTWLNVPLSRADTISIARPTGCPSCRHSGYRGRLGLFELLTVDDTIRRLVQDRAVAADIKSAAIAAGMTTLRDDGLLKVIAGKTTIGEVEKVTVEAPLGAGVDE